MAKWMYVDAVNLANCPRCHQIKGKDCRTPKGYFTTGHIPHMERTSELLKISPKENYQGKVYSFDDIMKYY